MENFRVTFEMTNGEAHFYEIESESITSVYELVNSSPDGWIEVPSNGESHFIKADKITRWKIISEADFSRKQQENNQQIINAFQDWNSF